MDSTKKKAKTINDVSSLEDPGFRFPRHFGWTEWESTCPGPQEVVVDPRGRRALHWDPVQ